MEKVGQASAAWIAARRCSGVAGCCTTADMPSASARPNVAGASHRHVSQSMHVKSTNRPGPGAFAGRACRCRCPTEAASCRAAADASDGRWCRCRPRLHAVRTTFWEASSTPAWRVAHCARAMSWPRCRAAAGRNRACGDSVQGAGLVGAAIRVHCAPREPGQITCGSSGGARHVNAVQRRSGRFVVSPRPPVGSLTSCTCSHAQGMVAGATQWEAHARQPVRARRQPPTAGRRLFS